MTDSQDFGRTSESDDASSDDRQRTFLPLSRGGTRSSMPLAEATRQFLRKWPAAVLLVLVDETEAIGMTVTAFMPVSLNPPCFALALMSPGETERNLPLNAHFELVLLSRFQGNVAKMYARPSTSRYELGEEAALLASPAVNSLGNARLIVRSREQVGDHVLIIADVLSIESREGHPLVYKGGAFMSFR